MIQVFPKKKKKKLFAHTYIHIRTQKLGFISVIQFTARPRNSCIGTIKGTANCDEGARTRGHSRQETAWLRPAFPSEKKIKIQPLYKYTLRAQSKLFPRQWGSTQWREAFSLAAGREFQRALLPSHSGWEGRHLAQRCSLALCPASQLIWLFKGFVCYSQIISQIHTDGCNHTDGWVRMEQRRREGCIQHGSGKIRGNRIPAPWKV